MLAVQHGVNSHYPGKWEFPGGKIQPGETAKACIVREIREELTVEIKVLAELLAVEFDYEVKQVKLIPFVCQIISGSVELTEHENIQWFNMANWKEIDWLEADRKMILCNIDPLNTFLE